jgi:restriction system protein
MIRPRSAETVRCLLDPSSWAGAASTVVASVGLAYVLPAFGATDPALRGAALVLETAAPWAAGALLVFAPAAVYFGRRRRPLNPIGSLDALRRLSRRDFDAVLTESFRLQGYAVEGRAVADDSIGLLLRKPDRKILVQCRHRTDPQVGVEAVRLLHETILAEGASGGLIVSCNDFTSGARALAADKPIGLIEGRALLELLTRGRPADPKARNATVRQEPHFGLPPSQLPDCPICGSPMVPTQDGQNSGAATVLWNCSLRRCDGTLAA